MNKLMGIEGGQPLYTDDLLFMQQSSMEAMKGIVASIGMGQTNVVLSGCVITIGSASGGRHEVKWTEGFVAIGGEMYPVKAGNTSVQQGYGTLYWVVKKEAYELRDFENGAQNKVYERSEAVVSAAYAAGETHIDVNGMYDFKGSFEKYVTKYEPEDILHSVNNPDNVSASCVLHECNNGFAICQVHVSVKRAFTATSNVLFAYAVDPIFGIVSPVVFGISKLCIFKMLNGAAYLYDADGNALTSLDEGSFAINLLIKR